MVTTKQDYVVGATDEKGFVVVDKYGHMHCSHAGLDRLPTYTEGYCYAVDEYFCLECGWCADMNSYHDDICDNPQWCLDQTTKPYNPTLRRPLKPL